jgi:hypothetical protein
MDGGGHTEAGGDRWRGGTGGAIRGGQGKRMAKVSQEYIDILLKEKATCTGMYNEIRSMEYIMEGYRFCQSRAVRHVH